MIRSMSYFITWIFVFIDELSTPAIKSLIHEVKAEDFFMRVLSGTKDFEKLGKHFSNISQY